MPKRSQPLIFFGSGPVAAESLRLLAKEFTVEAVVTKPRAAHHKGEVPVLDVVDELGLKAKTATDKRGLDQLFGSSERPFTSNLAVLVDFGIIVSQQVIDYFPLGIINSHFSVLPEWRGADPITFAVLSGQKITGVSLMLLVAAMDEGPLLAYGEYNLSPGIATPELTSELIKLSDALLQETITGYRAGYITAVPQTVTGREVSYSRKLTKADGIIDWHKPAKQLEREVRAFAQWPKSRATVAGHEVIITKAHAVPVNNPKKRPGDVEAIKPGVLTVECGSGRLCIEQLKPAGKKEMSAQAFLSGYGSTLKA